MSRLQLSIHIIGIAALTIAGGEAAHAVEADATSIIQQGNDRGAPPCNSCHGVAGEGNPEMGFPRLSELAPAYMVHQLASFDNGSRKSDIMEPIAKALTGPEREALGAYYSAQKPTKAEAGEQMDQQLIARGAVLAETGDWARSLPGCGQCHGPSGQGVGFAFPALAGQSQAYITAQLTAWKTKARTNDPLGLMAGVANKLSDEEIAAVSAYYESLPVVLVDAPAGESR